MACHGTLEHPGARAVASGMNRAIATACLIVIIVTFGSGCGTPRVAFAPTSGPPQCTGNHGEYAPAEWQKFNADVARVAKALNIDEKNPTIVRERLDLAVRTLTDNDGCVMSGALGEPGGYTISCG